MCRFGIVFFVVFSICLTNFVICSPAEPREVSEEAKSQPATQHPARALNFLSAFLNKSGMAKTAKPVVVYPKATMEEKVLYVPYPYQTPIPYPYPYPAPRPPYPTSLHINTMGGNRPTPQFILPYPNQQPIQISPVLNGGGTKAVPATDDKAADKTDDKAVDRRIAELQERLIQERERAQELLKQLEEELKKNKIYRDSPSPPVEDTEENPEDPENSEESDDDLEVTKLNEEAEEGTPAIVIEKGYLVLLNKNEFKRLPANSALTILE